MALVQDYSAAYHAGTIGAVILLAGVLVILLRRVIAARPVPAAAVLVTSPASAMPVEHAGSFAPPGAQPVAATARPAPASASASASTSAAGAWPRRRALDAAGAVLVVALLVFAIAHVSFGDSRSAAWSSASGTLMRTGFMLGCQRHDTGTVDCGCLFDHLSSLDAYNTPAKFVGLQSELSPALQNGDAGALPPGVFDAMRACVHPAA